jgi:hypothetical protein
MHARQRILRGIDGGGGLGLPHRLEVGHHVAARLHVDELGDDLHEGRAGATGVTKQFGRRRGGFAHQLVFAIEEQHARLAELEHGVGLRARHHQLFVARAQPGALRNREDGDADQADQRCAQGHDREIDQFHDSPQLPALAETRVAGSMMPLSTHGWRICSSAPAAHRRRRCDFSRDFAMRRSSKG